MQAAGDEIVLLDRKFEAAGIRVIACPAFRFCTEDGAQGFAALHLRALLCRLFRFGMERAGGLLRIGRCGHRRERAMIGDRNPGTDGNCHYQPTRGCSHDALNRRRGAIAQILSFESLSGAAPVAVTSGGEKEVATSVAAVADSGGSCLIRVDISIAAKRSAAARK